MPETQTRVGTTDMLAAAAVGAIKVLVRTGWGENSLMAYRKDWYEAAEPDFIAADLLEAAQWLIALKVG
ncbi:HAD hydrolase-like protein [Paenibacillus sp. FSL H7-0357]|uniref:HAD hydrolase-like protein n=1 Tax=unclassified Paenibacillus TaxID=185978 RepID=UPI001E5DE6EF|nr:HAD hydrolase-like protein [Paenibacillus sp. FSL H7-0357]